MSCTANFCPIVSFELLSYASGVSNLEVKIDGKPRSYALLVADTIVVRPGGAAPEVLTAACNKAWTDVAYFFKVHSAHIRNCFKELLKTVVPVAGTFLHTRLLNWAVYGLVSIAPSPAAIIDRPLVPCWTSYSVTQVKVPHVSQTAM